jgi:hypothetical protein
MASSMRAIGMWHFGEPFVARPSGGHLRHWFEPDGPDMLTLAARLLARGKS